MIDIVERLRKARCYHVDADSTRWLHLRPDYLSIAADEIERLRIQLKEARKTEETENPIATAMRTTLRNLGYNEAQIENLLKKYNV